MTIPQESVFCIDLHCHSTASDGALAPADLVRRAAEKGVTHLALTDHDTIDGLAEAGAQAHASGIALISGTELSCLWKTQTIHVVGLDFDPHHSEFQSALARQHENRWARARMIVDRLQKLGVSEPTPDGLALFLNLSNPPKVHYGKQVVFAALESNKPL